MERDKQGFLPSRVKMRLASILLAATLIMPVGEAYGCVGDIITIAIPDAPAEQILAELVAVLLTERTGTHVQVKTFENQKRIFDAVKVGEAGILIENTDRALAKLGKKKGDGKDAFVVSKNGYQERFNLIWLKPFGVLKGGPNSKKLFGPVITTEIMRNFPALPRVVNKLAGVLEENDLPKMIAAVLSGKDKKSVARDYLRSKRLI